MADFQTRFGETLDRNIAATNAAQAALESLVPGLHPANVRRLLNNVSSLLGKIDRRQIAHPEFLAGSPTSVPERAIELAAGIESSLAAGPENFVQVTLPALVDTERRLIQAVGVGEYKIQDIKNSQVRALNQIIDRAAVTQRTVNANSSALEKELADAKVLAAQVAEKSAQAKTDSDKISEIRKLADKLAKGNASQNPLEKSVRIAREKMTEIEAVLETAANHERSASTASIAASASEAEVAKVLDRLGATEEKARNILNTATQAGLAGAYKLEREKLEKQQKWFAYGFYGIIAAIISYAAVFIIPLISKVFESNPNNSITPAESAFMLAVRIVVIAPAFWALIFTNRRYTNLETLQMDYAAKTTTALAYFGYKDEMDEDPNLSTKLKDGLVARFIEHPSRLLGKKVESSASIIGPDGTKVISEAHSPGIDATIKLDTGKLLGGEE